VELRSLVTRSAPTPRAADVERISKAAGKFARTIEAPPRF